MNSIKSLSHGFWMFLADVSCFGGKKTHFEHLLCPSIDRAWFCFLTRPFGGFEWDKVTPPVSIWLTIQLKLKTGGFQLGQPNKGIKLLQ